MQIKQSGFTLIECLVALFIIAVVLASSTKVIGLSIADVHDSFSRQVANWISENEYNQFRLDEIYPEIGTKTKNITMGGIDFITTITVIATPNQYFRRIDISVAEQSKPQRVIYKNTAFISQF
jgi:general secretion pathway protein I